MSTGIAQDTDTVILDALDFDEMLPCEGLTHSQGAVGHDPDAAGTIILTAPCCGKGVILCQPRIEVIVTFPYIRCIPCGVINDAGSYTITPIYDNASR